MCLPGISVLSSTKEDHQNKLLVTCCYLLTSISSLVAIVIKGLMIWTSKMSPKQFASGMGWLCEV